MAEEPKEDSPYIANLKFREKELGDKIKRLESAKDQHGFDRKGAIQRAQENLKEIRAELKAAK